MTTIRAERAPHTAEGAFRGTARRLALTYRLGGRSVVVAPVLLALAILPEFIQHIVEIKLGMFASTEAFRAHAMDSTRWAFGYAKVAGFVLAILGIARFWAVGSLRATVVAIPPRHLLRLVLGCVAGVAVAQGIAALQGHGTVPDLVLGILSAIIQLGLTLYVTGALLGDDAATLRWSFTAAWPRALFTLLLLVATFAPCQALHMLDHRLAIGTPAPLVWVLMIWDALFVGLFAALVGAATFVGYRHGPDWRGWAERG